MANGNDGSAKIFLLFSLTGSAAVITRVTLERGKDGEPPTSPRSEKPRERPRRLVQRHPIFFFILFLLFGELFIPRDPWKHMSSTILYDVISAVSTTIVEQSLREMKGDCAETPVAMEGVHPLGASRYSPATDQYYISNLEQEVIPFIAEALADIKITNVVQIVLESMRADCYPFQEDGLLHQHIKSKLHLAEGGVPITTETVSPFIASLANQTILWNNTWSVCPLTHKAMLGCTLPAIRVPNIVYCGQLPLPIDFGAEFVEPATHYQTCYPQVFKHIHSVTDHDAEIISLLNTSAPPDVTDTWDTTHVAAFSSSWDRTEEHLRHAGFNAQIDAQLIEEVRGGQEWPHFQGYYDEGESAFVSREADG